MKVFLLPLAFFALCLVGSNAEDWYEHGDIYQIYVRSFQDSDGDGIGDLNGLTTRLDYMKYLGVTGVLLSPIFASPQKDLGYDISDYYAIHEDYGSMDDFNRLVKKCEQLGIKLILDFVPNHTSDQHDWFIKSKNRVSGYEDFYVWQNGTILGWWPRPVPNNWKNTFGGSAWTLDATRNDYYLNQVMKGQPDLNFRNPKVVEEIKKVILFWLKKGVNGLRCDSVQHLFEKERKDILGKYFKDEAKITGCTNQNEYKCLKHTETLDQDETYDLVYQLRKLIDEEFGDSRIIITEASSDTSVENAVRYYGASTSTGFRYGSQIPMSLRLISQTNVNTKPSEYKSLIEEWISKMPKGDKLNANWVLGSHDQKRTASRFGPKRADLVNILSKTLPGVGITYMGEELGMTDVEVSWENTVDPPAKDAGKDKYKDITRDPERTPFQWDSTKNAGFSTATKTWLPVATNYTKNNLKLQMSDSRSHLSVYRRLLLLRKSATMKYGDTDIVVLNKDKVLAIKREIKGTATYAKKDVFLVLLNLDTSTQTVSLNNLPTFEYLPKTMEVAVVSGHSKNYFLSDVVSTFSNIKLEPDVGIVFVATQ